MAKSRLGARGRGRAGSFGPRSARTCSRASSARSSGSTASRSNDPASAATAFADALRLGQPDVPARIRLADALDRCGRKIEARAQYEVAVAHRPESAEARDALAKFYHLEGDLDDAVREFKEAVKLEPREPVFWNNLGTAYRSKRDYRAALDALATATSLAPSMVDPYYNRGEIYSALGRNEEARRQYLLALELDPSFVPARQALERASRSAVRTP